jgi:3-dehydroquinate synthase
MRLMKFLVRPGDRSYPIYLGSHLLNSLGDYCKKHAIPKRVVVLADKNSARIGMGRALGSLRKNGYHVTVLVIPPGERQKSIRRVKELHSVMLKAEIPRSSALIALGGGVVGDLGGFVAATYRRGIMFVQCPTTLLSQVDSSVGGKNGVNHPLAKNAIGTFLQPAFVLSDLELLGTLPRREVVAGLGEVLKYPFVGDPALLDFIEQNLERLLRVEPLAVREVASRCLQIKTTLVSMDERELMPTKGRALLNVGHVIGHALETLSKYRIRHGEAVLLGIIAEAAISVRRGWLEGETLVRLISLYRAMRHEISIEGITIHTVQSYVMRKRPVRFVLPCRNGRLRVVQDVSSEEVREGLKLLRNSTKRNL